MWALAAGLAMIGGAALLERAGARPVRRNTPRRAVRGPHVKYLIDQLASGYYQRAILRWGQHDTSAVDQEISDARRRLREQGVTPIELRVLEAQLGEETERFAQIAVAKNGGKRRTSHRRRSRALTRNGLSIIDERSPLEYDHSAPVLRLSVVDPDAEGPGPNDVYFAPDVKVGSTRRKKLVIPGASPGVVAWVDYHLIHGYGSTGRGVYIDYMRTRRDQTQRGHMKRLVEALMERYPGDDIDFGDIVSDHVEKIWRRLKDDTSHGRRIYGKLR